MIKMRTLTEQDFDEAIKLSEYAFQYKVSNEDYERRINMLKSHEIWGEYEDEALISKLHILHMQINIGNKLFEIGGVAGVATYPEHRRKGSVSRLLRQSLLSMKERGQTISLLHPFDIAFYRRFGWELTASVKKYTLEKKDLFRYPDGPGRIMRFGKDEGNDVLNTIYEQWFEKYNHMLVRRNDTWWNHHVFTDGYNRVVYFNENNEAEGYLCCKAADKLLDVQEMVYVTEAARRALWNFIAQHDSMVDKVKIIAPNDDQLPFLLQNPRITQETHPYFMARIVDVEAFLKQYEFENITRPITIAVTDKQCSWNNAAFQIGPGGVTPGDSSTGLTMDVGTLTAVLLNAVPAAVLYETGQITGPREDLNALVSAATKKPVCFIDFF
ncbi:enhanced intracellular survival protein Eis [Fictibacillus iocasae]|uniref:Enhanced intracellular survival protein Eis n=1 Tax=Fictibacillus iocasae TaxID=2715437 RepID=A0ABW2NRG5_9BACL